MKAKLISIAKKATVIVLFILPMGLVLILSMWQEKFLQSCIDELTTKKQNQPKKSI
jgi:hypothetical protein